MRTAGFLATVVVGIHLLYLVFVVAGGFLALRDIRWLGPHVASVVWGVVGTLTAAPCPITALEKWLITLSGGTPYNGPFISHYLVGTLYPLEAQWLVWQLTALVVLTSYGVVARHHLRAHLFPGRPHRPA
jgi:hypothetical protein